MEGLKPRTKQHLIPRDIAEGLAKKPPQDLDLEQAVLGAMMLEQTSYERVKFIKPEHFYTDAHREICAAIHQTVSDGNSPDMRMVLSLLRKSGKVELVGGAYYLAELTSKVSAGTNVEQYAVVLVELHIKRELIKLSMRIQEGAYKDTQDVFELIDLFREDIRILEDRETAISSTDRIKALWDKLQVKEKPLRPETLIKFGDADVCTVGNISLLVGKKKSRKSLLISYMIHLFLKSQMNLQEEVIVFDTEQEEYDVWQARDRIYRMTDMYVPHFCLRGLSPKERRDFIEQTITHWPTPPKIAVIDGIRDCMSNINDPDETTEVMSWLLRLNVDTKVHFINVLHLNKTDGNARGHIGTELLNKAEITIEVEIDQKSGASLAKCESSRRKPFESFFFTHGPTGLPELQGVVVDEAERENRDEIYTKLSMCFDGEMLKFRDLKEQVKAYFGIGDTKAKQLIANYVQRGWILKSGPDRSPNTVYKLSPTAVPSKPVMTVVQDSPPPPPPPPEDYSEQLPF